ncbi:MAG: N-acetylmuramoyl-L-alanine amidase [Candidatus Nanopelagicales bacterium]
MKRTLAVLAAALLGLAIQPSAFAAEKPLAGRVIVLDPGHQLGNSNPKFAKQMSATKFNGSIVKGCNTTGTATNDGLPEATFNWRVAKRLRALLEEQGATVIFTRSSNSRDAWGPCTWDRARIGTEAKADAMISIHADGAPSSGRGFHVIAPSAIKGWTTDVAKPGQRLARAMIRGMSRAGAEPATYLSSPLSVRGDQTTLNFSDVPTVIVELGNMRNKADAARMSTSQGQQQYAEWIAAGIDAYFS